MAGFPHCAHPAAADLVHELERAAEEGGRDLRPQQASRTEREPRRGKRTAAARAGGTPAASALVGRIRHESARTRPPISRSPSPASSTVATTPSRGIPPNGV